MTKYFTKEGDEFKEVEDELFTQDGVNDIVGKRVERVKEQFADYDDLKAKAGSVDTIKTEYETKLTGATANVDKLTKDLNTAKLATDKVKIMHEFKLPDEMDEFVTGDTVEDMRKRAEKLAKTAKGGKIPIKKDPKEGNKGTSDTKRIAGELFGGKSDD